MKTHYEAYSSFKSETLDCSRVLFLFGSVREHTDDLQEVDDTKKAESRRYFWVLVRIS